MMGVGSILSNITETVRTAADASLARGEITEAEHAAMTGSLLSPAIDEINSTLGDAFSKLNLNVQGILEPLIESLTEATEPLQPSTEAAAEATEASTATEAAAQADATTPAEATASAEPAAATEPVPEATGFNAKVEAAMEAVRTLQDENPAAFEEAVRALGEQAANPETSQPEPAEPTTGGGGMFGAAISELSNTVNDVLGNLEDGGLAGIAEPVLEQAQGILDQVEGLVGSTSVSDVIDVEVAEGEMDEVVVEAVSDREAEANELERIQQQAAQLLNQAQAMASQLTEDNTSTNGDNTSDSGATEDTADDEGDDDEDAAEPADTPEPEETETADPDPSELTE